MSPEEHPVWVHFLSDVPGCTLEHASVLFDRIDIKRARYPSALWRLTGFAPPGEERELGHDPVLKDTLVDMMSETLEFHGKYAGIYDESMAKMARRSMYLSRQHQHNRAFRYTIKMFLVDLYVAWRTAEWLPLSEPWQE